MLAQSVFLQLCPNDDSLAVGIFTDVTERAPTFSDQAIENQYDDVKAIPLNP